MMSDSSKKTDDKNTSRRSFIKKSSIIMAGGAMAGSLGISRSAHAFGSDEIKIGLIGCGGRGTGAANQAMNTEGAVKLVAMADVFADRLQTSYRTVKGSHKDKVEVPAEQQFVGYDGYKQVLQTDVDMVILATPPGFRPLHLEEAIAAGKHVFMEKPVATDAPGVRRVLRAGEEAKKKDLAIAVGLQRRHEVRYRETIERLKDGAIGEFVLARAYWNGSTPWTRPRKEGQTELEYQMRNWYYFNWICGDHITEQHIHNLDVINWLMDGYPVEAQGQGGREVRKGKDHGQTFDHHLVEFTYQNGTKMFSQCRHIRNCWNAVSEHVHGTKGYANISGSRIYDLSGNQIFRSRGAGGGHQQEHHNLFADLRAGKRPNEAEYGAKSTMTAIFGRMATYSGQRLFWKDAIESEISLADTDNMLTMEDEAPVQPDADGNYPIPIPGVSVTV